MNGPLIGMLGPIELGEFRDYLPAHVLAGSHPMGLGGTPVNLLSRELLRRGHRLVIFSLDPSVETEWIAEGERLKICVGPFTPRRARRYFNIETAYLVDAIRREKPDILHAQWTYEYALAAIASGLPHVVTAHDAPLNILRHNFIPYRIVRTLMAYQAARGAQRVVAVSPYVARHLKRFRFHTKPIEVVPNGIPEAQFGVARGDGSGGLITFATILSVWSSMKNGKVAIEAFATLRRTLPNARLLMFGDGHASDGPAAEWARVHGWEDGISFIGQRPYSDVMDTLSRKVDILIHPSLEESFGLTLIEAMAHGIPVIGGDHSGAVPWVLGDGKYGVLVDVRSPEKVAAAMLHLAQNGEERLRLGQTAREATRQRFHISRVADSYETIYARLAGSIAA
jgi:glycosyltransferase involved in cell wall biosynthesis